MPICLGIKLLNICTNYVSNYSKVLNISVKCRKSLCVILAFILILNNHGSVYQTDGSRHNFSFAFGVFFLDKAIKKLVYIRLAFVFIDGAIKHYIF